LFCAPLNRLHNIRQNGFAYLVYSDAKTCRFEQLISVKEKGVTVLFASVGSPILFKELD